MWRLTQPYRGSGAYTMDIVLHLVSLFYRRFRRPLDGRKKLQKLLFLIEHWNPETGEIVPSQKLTGFQFKIWFYGPFSQELVAHVEKLVKKRKLIEECHVYDLPSSIQGLSLNAYSDDGTPRRIYLYSPGFTTAKEQLAQPLKERLHIVLDRFGERNPIELEAQVNKMLKLTPMKKLEYWGLPVDEYIKRALHS